MLVGERRASQNPGPVLITLLAAVAACNTRVRQAEIALPDPKLVALAPSQSRCAPPLRGDRAFAQMVACTAQPRAVRAWGAPPREGPPVPQCPVLVHVLGEAVVAEMRSMRNAFDPVPWNECVPPEFLVGSRRVARVDDGWLVAYATPWQGKVFWTNDDNTERREISAARIAGFARTERGEVLALAVGHARLGRGGVLSFDHRGHGEYAPRLVATLPLEPSLVSFDDRGALVGYAQGFLFRADESGKVENVHYIARSIGHVASIARAADGTYFLGLECGVLRLVPTAEGQTFREDWWSARDGASGRWSPCLDG